MIFQLICRIFLCMSTLVRNAYYIIADFARISASNQSSFISLTRSPIEARTLFLPRLFSSVPSMSLCYRILFRGQFPSPDLPPFPSVTAPVAVVTLCSLQNILHALAHTWSLAIRLPSVPQYVA